MTLRMKRVVLPLVVIIAVTVSLALSQARRDVIPPEVFVDVASEVPADLPFDVFLSANEPVSYTVTYGDLEVTDVEQDLTVSLLALAGERELRVVAIDAAGNSSTYRFEVLGLPAFEPVISTSDAVIPGEAISAVVQWNDTSSTPESVTVRLQGQDLPVYMSDTQAVALATVPLGSEAGTETFEIIIQDSYGRSLTETRTVSILADPRPVEELNLSSSLLSVITPEGAELEKQTLASAYASGANKPRWSSPFIMPIEGRNTSGFGQPRRYAAGGNISYHYGADIGAPAGTPIKATNDGQVMVAGFFPIKGGLVVIDHGAHVYSLYFHQSVIHVEAGQSVKQGDVIGEVGSTGLSTGPHLHWEMRVNEVATNPISWVGKLVP